MSRLGKVLRFSVLLVLVATVAATVSIAISAPAFAQSYVASVKQNISYGPNRLNRFDVYLPKNAKNAPVIFMVHGGGWFKGDKANKGVVANKVAYWLPKGYIFISINYGLMPKTNPLQQAYDVARALAKAQNLAPSWGGDPKAFTIMGHSSGAHLVAMLAANPKIATSRGANLWKSAVLIDSAALDVPAIMKPGHARFYDRVFGRNAARWKMMSPIDQIQGISPPILAICLSLRAYSCKRAKNFAKAARKMGTFITVFPVPLSHRKLNTELGKKGRYTKAVANFIK